MKKIIAFILLFFHLFTAVGFSMNVHYCGNHKSYSFLGLKIGKVCRCDHSKKQHKKSCCKDKKVEIKVHKKENISIHSFKLNVFTTTCLVPEYIIFVKAFLRQTGIVTLYTGHPPNHSLLLYLLYQVFRI